MLPNLFSVFYFFFASLIFVNGNSLFYLFICFFLSLFLRWSFALVDQAGVQWRNLAPPQPLPSEVNLFSCLSLPHSCDYRHAPSCPDDFVFLVETEFLPVDLASLELLTSGDQPFSTF